MIPIYVDDIRCSLKNRCYFSALSLALTLPDVCGMAEFPDKQVSERYIEWYDKYIGDYMAYGKDELGGNNPWLSGEVVYNLRNTFLHQGNLGIEKNKVKEEVNRFDKFTLLLGDGTDLQMSTFNVEAGTEETGKIIYRAIIIDVTYLCDSICDFALWYYENNQEKFEFDFNVITQEEWRHSSEEAIQFTEGDVYAKILNQILKNADTKNTQKKKQSIKKVSEEKREAQVRSFFGRHFKKQVYVDKKEEIIQAVLRAKTKQQVNNNLMKHFTGKEVKTIYQRLEPLIRSLPGK